MQSRIRSERHTDFIVTPRPDSSQLVDLHVYIIPKKVWRNRQNLAENVTMERAISAGFVRVPESLNIHDLRRYINEVCGVEDDFPKEWLYLRSVGRCLTKVKREQEKQLKVKNYRPPTTIASEIYLIEEDYDSHSTISTRGQDEHPNQQQSSNGSQMWIKPIDGSTSFNHHFNSNSSSAAKLSPRNLLKIREEQERLYHRQLELARKREEIEDQYQKEEEAASTIQNAFRNYRHRLNIKQQQDDAIEIERLQKQARQLTRRQAEVEHAEEKQANDVVRLSNRLEELRVKRIELEANRVLVVSRIQRLQTQIAIRRKEEKDLWKKKYLIEKNQNALIEEQNHSLSKNSTDIDNQLEQAKIRLKHSTKLRQQAEYESHLLRQKLHEISSSLNALEKYRLPKQNHMTLQY